MATLRKSVYLIVRGTEDKAKNSINWKTLGTGFLAAPNRMVTAAHVISDASQGVEHKDGDKYYLIRRDEIESVHWHLFDPKINTDLFVYPDHDLAVIYLGENFYTNGEVEYANKNEFIRVSKELQPIGKDVGILGYPLCELKFKESDFGKPKIGDILLRADKGVINCKYKTSEVDYHYDFTMAFNPGNSGGPIFDSRNGRLISIVRGFKAIPIKNNEIIIPEEKRGLLKEYTGKSYIETIHANYSFGFSTVSFLDIFKKHKIF